MKHFYEITPGAALLAYLIYSAFVPITIAHSLILFSLAGLFGYSLFINSLKHPSMQKQMETLHEELKARIDSEKEIHELRLKKCEDATAQLVLAGTRVSSSPSPKVNSDKKIVF
jgi:hypothetical protein